MERGCAYFFAMTPNGRIQLFGELADSLSWGAPETIRRFLYEVLLLYARNIIVIENTDEEEPVVESYAVKSAEVYGELLQGVGAELLDVLVVGRGRIISLYREGHYSKEKYGAAKSLLSQNYLCEDDSLEDYGQIPWLEES